LKAGPLDNQKNRALFYISERILRRGDDMKRRFLIATVVAAAIALFLAMSWAGDGNVTILKPEDGAVVTGSSYTVEFTIDMGTKGDHVHIFLDGKHLAPVMRKGEYKLTRLKKGPHTVTLKLADRRHNYIGPEDAVKFTVE
jgi:hypothetical protein